MKPGRSATFSTTLFQPPGFCGSPFGIGREPDAPGPLSGICESPSDVRKRRELLVFQREPELLRVKRDGARDNVYGHMRALAQVLELLESTVLLAAVHDPLRRGRTNPGQRLSSQGTSAPSRIASIVVAYWAIRAAWSTPLMIRRAFL